MARRDDSDAIIRFDERRERRALSVRGLGFCPHHWNTIWGASALGYTTIVERILHTGFPIDSRTSDGETALQFAARYGRSDSLAYLLQNRAFVNCPDLLGRTPLMEAVHMGNREIVRLLLAADADPNRTDIVGRTALFYLNGISGARLLPILLHGGAKIEFADREGDTVLHHALRRADRSLVLELLRRFAISPNRHGRNGDTFLHAASDGGDLLLARTTIGIGTDSALPNRNGQTAVDVARLRGDTEMAALLS